MVLLALILLIPLHGLDLLGLAKLELTKKVAVVGFLDGTFGNPYPNLNIINPNVIRAHLLNGTLNNHACAPSYNKLIRAKNRLFNYTNKRNALVVYASPSLEHGCLRHGVVNRWFKHLKGFIPVCSTYKGYCPKNVIIEKHGSHVIADIVSNDGARVGKLKGNLITFLWHPCMNGRKFDVLPLAPRERTDFCSKRKLTSLLSSLPK